MSSLKRKYQNENRESQEPPSKRRKLESSSDEDEDETEEERRQRRLNKKLKKQARKQKNERENYFGYSNEDNPFNDSQLTAPFIWKKKYQSHGLKDKEIRDIQKQRMKDKQQILKDEIKKTKQRREQREKDKELEERLHAELAVKFL